MGINNISRSFNVFNFLILIILLISSIVASRNSKEVLFMLSSFILIILGWSLYSFTISRTDDLYKFVFSGLPIQFGASPEVFSMIFT